MKEAALRYAEILEKGAWVTHQEQDEIAKLLRKLVMTEAWDTTDMAHRPGGLSIDQESVAWLEYDDEGYLFLSGKRKGAFPVFIAPPSKPWVSLTDEDITEAFVRMRRGLGKYTKFAQIIEAKLKEKNT